MPPKAFDHLNALICANEYCRTRHNEGHYKRMAQEFLANIQLIAGVKLGEVIFQNIVKMFTDSDQHISFADFCVRGLMSVHR